MFSFPNFKLSSCFNSIYLENKNPSKNAKFYFTYLFIILFKAKNAFKYAMHTHKVVTLREEISSV